MKTEYSLIKDFDYTDVIINDNYFNNITKKDVDFLNTFNPDKLLFNFRLTAGFNTDEIKSNGPYSGWENTRIGGHTLGHYLTAAAQAIKNGYGNSSGSDGLSLTQRLDCIINGLKECQEKNDSLTSSNQNRHYGFIFGATMADSNNPELQFEKIKSTSPADTWVPWYTMHKILNGLIETAKLLNNSTALLIAQNLGEWIYNHTKKWSLEERNRVLHIEYGGMNDCLYELYSISKATDYENAEHFAQAAHLFDEEDLFNKIIAFSNKKSELSDVLNNHHANCTIPKFLGALNGYKAKGYKSYLEAAICFWDLVVNHHSYITGGNSECEHFGLDDVLDLERSNCNCETCNTHNMLKLTRELFKITGDIKYADFYEKTYFNAIMASVNPENGMTAYFQPMATGCFKNYCNPDVNKNYFWCCTGTGLENFTKLNDSLYFHSNDTLYVNVFLSSTVKWTDKNVIITQTTNVPETNLSTFKIECDDNCEFTLALRYPYWFSKIPELYVNESLIDISIENGFIKIKRNWKNGDIIQYKMYFELKAYSLPDNQESCFGFMYGPLVLAANLGKDTHMNIRQVGVLCDVSANKLVFGKLMPLNGNYGGTSNLKLLPGEVLTINAQSEKSVSDFMKNINNHFEKIESLNFLLKDTDCSSKLIFSPYYKLHSTRYGIYWIFKDNKSEIKPEKLYLEDTKTYIDGIGVGYGTQTEGDKNTWPCLEEEGNGSCADSGELTRYANKGGNFSYLVKVVPNKDNILKISALGTICTENSNDDNNPVNTLIIYAYDKGEKIILDSIQLTMAGEKQEKDIKIPSSLVDNSQIFKNEGFNVIRIYFEGKNKSQSAKLCAPLETYFY